MPIKGWTGRADQTTKVKGMFVRRGQIAEIGKHHPELGRPRLVVTRQGGNAAQPVNNNTARSWNATSDVPKRGGPRAKGSDRY
jgi:phenylacetate-CoA ligase